MTAITQTVRGVYQPLPTSRTSSSRRSAGGAFNWLIILFFPLFWILSATGKWGGGILGAGAGMFLPYTLIGSSWVVMLVGMAVGGLAGALLGALVRAGTQSRNRAGGFGGPFFWGGGGGFSGGGFSGGGGGFSGGGGSFGGGGSSGSW